MLHWELCFPFFLKWTRYVIVRRQRNLTRHKCKHQQLDDQPAHPDVAYVKKSRADTGKLRLNKTLSERNRHLASDAKHNPMLGWLIPCGARRLRFNGDTEGMTPSVCCLPSLHTASPLLFHLYLFPLKHGGGTTCIYNRALAHADDIHKSMRALLRLQFKICQKIDYLQMKSTGV